MDEFTRLQKIKKVAPQIKEKRGIPKNSTEPSPGFGKIIKPEKK